MGEKEMNKIILMGRLTRDPEVRYKNYGDGDHAIASFSLAVDRPRRGEENRADFFKCAAFGKQAEFVEKYLKKGTKILVTGRVQNDNYTNQHGEKVYGVSVLAQELEFCESKNKETQTGQQERGQNTDAGGFMNIPEEMDDEQLPFN